MQTFDIAAEGLRALNSALHALKGQTNSTAWEIVNPKGSHAIAVGLDAPIDVTVKGSTGYYCAGMNKQATVRVKGSAGPGLAENMMSGTVVFALQHGLDAGGVRGAGTQGDDPRHVLLIELHVAVDAVEQGIFSLVELAQGTVARQIALQAFDLGLEALPFVTAFVRTKLLKCSVASPRRRALCSIT